MAIIDFKQEYITDITANSVKITFNVTKAINENFIDLGIEIKPIDNIEQEISKEIHLTNEEINELNNLTQNTYNFVINDLSNNSKYEVKVFYKTRILNVYEYSENLYFKTLSGIIEFPNFNIKEINARSIKITLEEPILNGTQINEIKINQKKIIPNSTKKEFDTEKINLENTSTNLTNNKYFKSISKNENQTIYTLKENVNEIEITNLQPSTYYEFNYLVFNNEKISLSNSSNFPKQIKTLSGEKPEISIKFDNITANSLIVFLTINELNGNLIETINCNYTVIKNKYNENKKVEINQEINLKEKQVINIPITNLVNNQKYYFRFILINEIGENFIYESECITKSGIPVIFDPYINHINCSNVEIQIKYESNGISIDEKRVKIYESLYDIQENKPPKFDLSVSFENTVEINNLTRDTHFFIIISLKSGDKIYNSAPKAFKTKNGIPEFSNNPNDFSVENLHSRGGLFKFKLKDLNGFPNENEIQYFLVIKKDKRVSFKNDETVFEMGNNQSIFIEKFPFEPETKYIFYFKLKVIFPFTGEEVEINSLEKKFNSLSGKLYFKDVKAEVYNINNCKISGILEKNDGIYNLKKVVLRFNENEYEIKTEVKNGNLTANFKFDFSELKKNFQYTYELGYYIEDNYFTSYVGQFKTKNLTIIEESIEKSKNIKDFFIEKKSLAYPLGSRVFIKEGEKVVKAYIVGYTSFIDKFLNLAKFPLVRGIINYVMGKILDAWKNNWNIPILKFINVKTLSILIFRKLTNVTLEDIEDFLKVQVKVVYEGEDGYCKTKNISSSRIYLTRKDVLKLEKEKEEIDFLNEVSKSVGKDLSKVNNLRNVFLSTLLDILSRNIKYEFSDKKILIKGFVKNKKMFVDVNDLKDFEVMEALYNLYFSEGWKVSTIMRKYQEKNSNEDIIVTIENFITQKNLDINKIPKTINKIILEKDTFISSFFLFVEYSQKNLFIFKRNKKILDDYMYYLDTNILPSYFKNKSFVFDNNEELPLTPEEKNNYFQIILDDDKIVENNIINLNETQMQRTGIKVTLVIKLYDLIFDKVKLNEDEKDEFTRSQINEFNKNLKNNLFIFFFSKYLPDYLETIFGNDSSIEIKSDLEDKIKYINFFLNINKIQMNGNYKLKFLLFNIFDRFLNEVDIDINVQKTENFPINIQNFYYNQILKNNIEQIKALESDEKIIEFFKSFYPNSDELNYFFYKNTISNNNIINTSRLYRERDNYINLNISVPLDSIKIEEDINDLFVETKVIIKKQIDSDIKTFEIKNTASIQDINNNLLRYDDNSLYNNLNNETVNFFEYYFSENKNNLIINVKKINLFFIENQPIKLTFLIKVRIKKIQKILQENDPNNIFVDIFYNSLNYETKETILYEIEEKKYFLYKTSFSEEPLINIHIFNVNENFTNKEKEEKKIYIAEKSSINGFYYISSNENLEIKKNFGLLIPEIFLYLFSVIFKNTKIIDFVSDKTNETINKGKKSKNSRTSFKTVIVSDAVDSKKHGMNTEISYLEFLNFIEKYKKIIEEYSCVLENNIPLDKNTSLNKMSFEYQKFNFDFKKYPEIATIIDKLRNFYFSDEELKILEKQKNESKKKIKENIKKSFSEFSNKFVFVPLFLYNSEYQKDIKNINLSDDFFKKVLINEFLNYYFNSEIKNITKKDLNFFNSKNNPLFSFFVNYYFRNNDIISKKKYILYKLEIKKEKDITESNKKEIIFSYDINEAKKNFEISKIKSQIYSKIFETNNKNLEFEKLTEETNNSINNLIEEIKKGEQEIKENFDFYINQDKKLNNQLSKYSTRSNDDPEKLRILNYIKNNNEKILSFSILPLIKKIEEKIIKCEKYFEDCKKGIEENKYQGSLILNKKDLDDSSSFLNNFSDRLLEVVKQKEKISNSSTAFLSEINNLDNFKIKKDNFIENFQSFLNFKDNNNFKIKEYQNKKNEFEEYIKNVVEMIFKETLNDFSNIEFKSIEISSNTDINKIYKITLNYYPILDENGQQISDYDKDIEDFIESLEDYSYKLNYEKNTEVCFLDFSKVKKAEQNIKGDYFFSIINGFLTIYNRTNIFEDIYGLVPVKEDGPFKLIYKGRVIAIESNIKNFETISFKRIPYELAISDFIIRAYVGAIPVFNEKYLETPLDPIIFMDFFDNEIYKTFKEAKDNAGQILCPVCMRFKNKPNSNEKSLSDMSEFLFHIGEKVHSHNILSVGEAFGGDINKMIQANSDFENYVRNSPSLVFGANRNPIIKDKKVDSLLFTTAGTLANASKEKSIKKMTLEEIINLNASNSVNGLSFITNSIADKIGINNQINQWVLNKLSKFNYSVFDINNFIKLSGALIKTSDITDRIIICSDCQKWLLKKLKEHQELFKIEFSKTIFPTKIDFKNKEFLNIEFEEENNNSNDETKKSYNLIIKKYENPNTEEAINDIKEKIYDTYKEFDEKKREE